MERLHLLNEFYELLNQAKRKFPLRPLRDLHKKMKRPTQAVYYFFDEQQKRAGSSELKVIRVGTHAARENSKALVYGRLCQHKGTLKGLGNHRGSVFRELVGFGLINRHKITLPSWGQKKQKCAAEAVVEREVSEYLSHLLFTVVEVPGPSHKDNERAYVEKNSIALLSNFNRPPIDKTSSNWLGHQSYNSRVCYSDLWNSDFVDYPCPTSDFIVKLEQLVRQMKDYS